jgi:hypothetical protein
LKHLHDETARELNIRDHEPGRKVWYNFWDKTDLRAFIPCAA